MTYQSITELADSAVEQADAASFKGADTLASTVRELRERLHVQLDLNRSLETHARALALKATKASNYITQIECPHCAAKTQPAHYCGACGEAIKASHRGPSHG